MHLASEFSEDFENRVRCILLTDSAHGYANTPECIRKICINFEASDEPLDTDLGEFNGMITKSAGQLFVYKNGLLIKLFCFRTHCS